MQNLSTLLTPLGLRPRDALTWEGVIDGVRVELQLVPRPTPPRHFELAFTLSPEKNTHPSLFAVPRTFWFAPAHDALPIATLATFDQRFDESIVLRGEPWLIALFDHERRHELLSLMTDHTLVIDAGRVLLFPPPDHPQLADTLNRALALARHLGTTDLTQGVARYLADPSPYVRDHFTQFAKSDGLLVRLVASVRADASLRSPDITHAGLVAQVRDTALDLDRRATAFVELLIRFPWSETVKLLSRVKPLFGALSAANRGAGFVAVIEGLLPTWLANTSEPEAAFTLLEALWSVRPPLTPELGVPFARMMGHLARKETLPWLGELLQTRDGDQFEAALIALDAAGASRLEVRKLIGPSLRSLLIERAPRIARTQRRGAALLEVAASSVPPERPAQLLELVVLLGELGDPKSAPFLFTLVEHNDDDVREATLVALGRCGTVEHIDYLEPQTSGLFRSSRIKQLARDAIAEIRKRAGLRDVPGALSLSSDSPGGLTLPED